MDYEKKYNEALELAREKRDIASRNGADITVKFLEEIFPELRESEDERIRKALVAIVKWLGFDSSFFKDVSKDSALAWLEKQKEQPTDAKTERVIKAARRVLNNWLNGTDCPDVSGDFAELEYAIREYDGEEKQKEQKELPLMDGDADLYFDEWNQQKQNPTKRQCFEEGMRYAERLQKEQKQTDLPAGFYYIDLYGNKYYSKEFRYGDMKVKVGEQKPCGCVNVESEYDKGWRDGHKAGLKDAEMQKPAWSEEDESVIEWLLWFFENLIWHKDYRLKREDVISFLKSLRPQKKEDLPKWRKMPLGYEIRPANVCSIGVDVLDVNGKCIGQTGRTVLQRGDEYLFLDDLEKLPKED